MQSNISFFASELALHQSKMQKLPDDVWTLLIIQVQHSVDKFPAKTYCTQKYPSPSFKFPFLHNFFAAD